MDIISMDLARRQIETVADNLKEIRRLRTLVKDLSGVCQGWIDFASRSIQFRCLLASIEAGTALLGRTDEALTRARRGLEGE